MLADLTHFLQLGKFEMLHVPRPTNTQSCCVYGRHPPTLLPGRSSTPFYGQRKKPDHLHTNLTNCCQTARNISVAWKPIISEMKKY